jgi:hypothetical protein
VSNDDLPNAVVRVVDGVFVLDDPDALAFMTALERANCIRTLQLHAQRLGYFRVRIIERGGTAQTMALAVINADAPMGERFAEACGMPAGWAAGFRAKGEIPFARGIVDRVELQALLDHLGLDSAPRLRACAGVAAFVVDHGITAVIDLGPLESAP